MIGPNALPTKELPTLWITNNTVIMVITMGIVGMSVRIILKPSTADATEMGGVIIPSANRAQPPIMAGKIK
jgi:hypothetical protein